MKDYYTLPNIVFINPSGYIIIYSALLIITEDFVLLKYYSLNKTTSKLKNHQFRFIHIS